MRQDVPNIDGSLACSGFLAELGSRIFDSAPDAVIKRRRECVVRALADAGEVRTWNLLIDLVAQSGRFPRHAGDLSKFVVEGETRFWVHVAIDRFTGQIIAKQIEVVTQ